MWIDSLPRCFRDIIDATCEYRKVEFPISLGIFNEMSLSLIPKFFDIELRIRTSQNGLRGL